jgi:S-adenosylmethionine:tRNA ribosyltransferase-isomerase
VLTSDLDYDLPPERIATHPVSPPDAAKLLVFRRSTKAVSHHHVSDLPALLQRGDLLVRNDTSVLAARLLGHRAHQGESGRGGGKVEGLFVESQANGDWRVLLKAGGRLQVGERIALSPKCSITLVEPDGRGWIVRPSSTQAVSAVLDGCGLTPVPPYILKARRSRGESVPDAQDRQWYETCFADESKRGSVAAPTAGLHITAGVNESLQQAGVATTSVTLHVGEGTFRGVDTDTLEDHAMHSEYFHVEESSMATLRNGPAQGGRVIALGTTTARLLESLPEALPKGPWSGKTDLLIAPGHAWRHVEGLLTNFHLPRSTLLALVGALVGMDVLRSLYETAIQERYRFYSYGDAMLILP